MANPNLLRTLGVLFCAATTILAAVSAPAQQNQPVRIGNYTISNVKNIHMTNPKGDYVGEVVSANGSTVVFHSPDYDITAPRLEFTIKSVVTPGRAARLKATRVVATGNVKIVNRSPQNGQKTVITSNEAHYSATTNLSDRGIVRLNGNVRSEAQGVPGAAAPLTLTGDSGVIKFLTDGSLDVNLSSENGNGTLNGQFYESKPKGNQR